MSTFPEYTADEIKQLQSSDNVLSVVLNFVEQGKLTTQMLTKQTKPVKKLLRKFDSLVIDNGILYRKINDIECGECKQPPSLATPNQFVNEFFQFLEDIVPKYSNLIIMGDFNLHIEENSNAISEFNNSLDALGLIQHVDFPTHIHGRSLDLVITEFTNGVDLVSCEAGPFLSDHCAVKVTTRVQKENIVSKSISFRNFKNMNKQNFSEDLQKLSLDSDNVETFVGEFENTIESLLNTHAPMQEKTQICRAPKPWFNETIMSLKRLMRKSERLWRKHRKPCDYEIYKSSMNKYHHELRNEKHSILSQKVLSFKGDSKKLYKFVKDLTGSKAENPMPAVENENELPDKFADFFMNKIKTIRDSLRDFDDYKPLFKDVPLFTSFKNLSEDEVKTIINKLQCKSCELDILPTKSRRLPIKMEASGSQASAEKAGLELIYSNYRPVSNLSFLSKLIEKCALYRLNEHVKDHDLLPINQSAYRQFHSCESALLRLVNDILDGMEHQEVTAMIAVDLSAAFDTVDHSILINVLEYQYGVNGTALKWIDSYLRPRSCRVNVSSTTSSERQLECSVPQGSCLGPWLYLVYAGTLFDIIPPSITVYGFADDHTANKRFVPTLTNEMDAIRDLQDCAVLINTWMNSNKLKMNNAKTEFILFGSRQQLSKCQTKQIIICGDVITSKHVYGTKELFWMRL
ncbi:unnamed protein product [Mytilus edulis]|uniref:Reverse transcriptase domain-containing protein n=1 Tax=Mytilus edulis TaxID=6550 RepID=A0A8S3TFY4_MYTED|nr:unnamed protein product [Mytilus edulis]